MLVSGLLRVLCFNCSYAGGVACRSYCNASVKDVLLVREGSGCLSSVLLLL